MSHSKLHIRISRPFQILMTVLVILFVIAAADGIFFAITEVLASWQNTPIERKSQIMNITEELTPEEQKQQRIDHSKIRFQDDGTIHLFYDEPAVSSLEDFSERRSRLKLPTILQVYDTNDNLLWQGQPEDIPYKYLIWSKEETYSRDEWLDYRNYQFNSKQLRGIQAFFPGLSQTLEIRLERE